VEGFLLIDKPSGPTSHDVVAKLRGITGIKRIGHGGTLDPLATGLLVIGLGAATKQLEQFVQGDKTYLATVCLGATSTTDDAEGELKPVSGEHQPKSQEIKQALSSLVGPQQQLPPVYSAIKTKGKKHYELARAGKPGDRTPRPVTIHSIELLDYTWPDVRFRTSVSKGTYIRALARDLGDRLGTGGYLSALRRERVGAFRIEDAHSLDELAGRWQDFVVTPVSG
jgi:tRNA pseudouridine55 synthase